MIGFSPALAAGSTSTFDSKASFHEHESLPSPSSFGHRRPSAMSSPQVQDRHTSGNQSRPTTDLEESVPITASGKAKWWHSTLHIVTSMLLITAPPKAKWWHSTFHIVTSIVGIGVLSLPHAMSRFGWGAGVAFLTISFLITFYTLWQMVEMHEMVPEKRFDRYHELGQNVFGQKRGLWLVVLPQLVAEIMLDIMYLVTGGKCLQNFHNAVCRSNCKDIMLTYFIIIFSSAHFILAQLPNLNSISGISLAAAVMSLGYSTTVWGASIDRKDPLTPSPASPSLPPLDHGNTEEKVLEWCGALGVLAFAYSAHVVVLEIQATLPSTPEKPSKKPMWKGAVVAYIIVALCYFPVALVGYGTFGDEVESNILDSLRDIHKNGWLIPAVNMMVVVHNIGSYQVYAMPVFDLIETMLIKKFEFPQRITLRLVARTFYVAFTMFMAITFPYISGLVGFLGGFALVPTSFLLPCIMWRAIHKPRKWSLSWIANWICIALGVALMILSIVCGFWKIVKESGTYKLYDWIK